MVHTKDIFAVVLGKRERTGARIPLHRGCDAISDVPLRLANEVCAKTRELEVCESPLKFHSAVWLPTIRYPRLHDDATHRLTPRERAPHVYSHASPRSRKTCAPLQAEGNVGGHRGRSLIDRRSPHVLAGEPPIHSTSATYYHHLSVSRSPSCPTRM